MSTILLSSGNTYLIGGGSTVLYAVYAEAYSWDVGITYTFTNGGSTGANAMTTLPNYTPAPFYPTYITMPQRGYQYLTIANSGSYQITCFGAQGNQGANGTSGPGGTMRGTVSLSSSDVIILCVGQTGINGGSFNASGGGGMSAVFLSSGGTGTPTPLLVAAGGGGTAGPGTGDPPTNYNGFGPSSSWDTESTASALQGNDRSAGSATQVSVAGTSTFSYGLINSSGTRLSGVGSTNLPGNAGGWGGAGCGGGGAGNGGGGGGWRGSVNTPVKEGGRAGTNFARSTLSSVSYVGNNAATGRITIQRIS